MRRRRRRSSPPVLDRWGTGAPRGGRWRVVVPLLCGLVLAGLGARALAAGDLPAAALRLGLVVLAGVEVVRGRRRRASTAYGP